MHTKYSKLDEAQIASVSGRHHDEDIEQSVPFLTTSGIGVSTKGRRLQVTTSHWVIHCISLPALVFLIGKAYIVRDSSQAQCWDLFNWWSPVNGGVAQFPFVNQRFNGSLRYKSPFKGPPSPEEEQAWSKATEFGMFALSREDLLKLHALGHSPDVVPERSARYPPELGEGYIATTVGAHQLHRLHNLWMDHHIDYFPAMQAKMKDVPAMYELHYEHCVDFIRQSLMCHYDTGIITYNWVRGLQNPTPNANVPHRCVDLGPLNDWLSERAITVPEGFEWFQPADAYSMAHHPN